ncbi:hypothetical protein Q9R08_14360 [Microbacterium sp. QXD-8]|uniref:Uncharacterized protein n=1 Tax=Microbacterium psychrotolerans TaxID=3068321 RepID=A0ABU0Z3K2_9MICO|nr:hypothetical protein [Microbacterium sp. QXD-8]MDQ7879169.1 hypothetical protein [Microbacterium sp. QXD-8]
MSDVWGGGPGNRWQSGAWSLELRDDEFADIAYDGHVVLRSVRAVVRDRNWDTAGLVVDRVAASDLALTLHVHSAGLGADLSGIVRAEVRGPGRLRVLTDLESRTEFATNRTGLVVLHPPALAGAAVRVRHSDGTVVHSQFPERISPHQPALDIAGLSWSRGGLEVDVRFTGDVFEMEDQRNWTDASYKTYSRPLALPFPYTLAAGERVVQTIDIAVSGTPTTADPDPVARIRLEEGPPLPAIGVSASTAPDPAPADRWPADGGAWPATVLVELDLATRNWRAALDRAAGRDRAESSPGSPGESDRDEAAPRPLDVRFVLDESDPASIDEAVHALRGLPVARVTAFRPTGPARHVSDLDAIARLRHALTEAGLDIAVVGGVRSHFTELNREHHRLPRGLAGIVFSSTPLFHSLSTAQLVESLPMQRIVATQGVRIAAGIPVHIGPISLRPHFNDVATTPPPMPEHDDLRDGYGSALLDAVDPRQSAPQLAAWTIASAAALAVPGVATLAYFEEWGPRGVRTADGTPLPALAAVSALAAMAGAPGLRGDSPDGLVWALGARTADGGSDSGAGARDTVLLANLDDRARQVEVTLPGGETRTAEVPPGSFLPL